MATETWVDHEGAIRKVPSGKRRMNFGKFPLHAQVRAFVFHRDGFTCQQCGIRAQRIPMAYSGRRTLLTADNRCLELDHKSCFRNGGTNHPDNLQCLCERCNNKKGAH